MKISELAEQAGLSVATVKYYLREGLLPPGRLTSVTQAVYDESHLDRLRLIRVMRDVGGVPVASIGAVLEAIDDDQRPLHTVVGTAHHALALNPAPQESHPDTRDEVLEYVRARGWDVHAQSPALSAVAEALEALRVLWGVCGPEIFDVYADAADTLAGCELAFIDESRGTAETVEQVIVGTVVFERALVGLRRLAENNHSNRRFKPH